MVYDKRADLEQKGIAAVLVNIGESQSQVQRFLKDKGYDFDTFMDTDSVVAEMYQVLGIPTIVFVGGDGKIRDI